MSTSVHDPLGAEVEWTERYVEQFEQGVEHELSAECVGRVPEPTQIENRAILRAATRDKGWTPEQIAVSGGEDHGL